MCGLGADGMFDRTPILLRPRSNFSRIGQQAIGIALDGGPNTYRHRIEHNTLLPDELIPVYSEYDVVALIFGNFPTCFFKGVTFQFKGSTPPEYQYLEWRYRPLVDTNPDVHFAWHADSPPMGPPDPFLHLHGFVTRIQYLDDGTVCEPPDWAADDLFTVEETLPMMAHLVLPAHHVTGQVNHHRHLGEL